MASRRIDDLSEPVMLAAQGLLRAAALHGLDVLIYCTLRSLAEQAQLYASGRTSSGAILTCARPGESLHNPDSQGRAWAFDCVPLIAGKPQWSNVEALRAVGLIGESQGLTWAGRWTGKLRESVHFQLSKKI